MESTYPYILHKIISNGLSLRERQLRKEVANPAEVQAELLKKLLSKAQKTAFGREFGFKDITSYRGFSSLVPVNDYEGIKSWINRAMQGEQDVLWPGPVRWFAKSSGTTGDKSKFIPVSREALRGCHFKAGRDLLATYFAQVPESRFFTGKGLIMGGSHQVNHLDSGSRYGDVSAVMLQNLPALARFFRAPGSEIALMDEWEAKIEQMAQNTIKRNITSISGVPTWTIVLIKRIFEITGKNNLKDVWPGLELYIHGGVSFTPYREQFKKLIDFSGMHYLETYNASEGFFAFQDHLGADDMLLLPNNGVFYEFVRLEEWDKPDARYYMLGEVELATKYALLISTNSGLWRYRIGDTVEFSSLQPYRIRIAGRIKHFINAFGEELVIENSDRAMAEACRQTGAEVREYTAAPVYMTDSDKGGHEWLIEFANPPANTKEFAGILDMELQKVNSDYEAKRYKSIALQAPLVRILRTNAFYEWLAAKGKLGGQHKVPRLSNSRDYVEELTEYVKG